MDHIRYTYTVYTYNLIIFHSKYFNLFIFFLCGRKIVEIIFIFIVNKNGDTTRDHLLRSKWVRDVYVK